MITFRIDSKYSTVDGLSIRQRICPKCRTALASLSDHNEPPAVRHHEPLPDPDPAFASQQSLPVSPADDYRETRRRKRRRPTAPAPAAVDSTDGPGVISLIFGCLAVACLLMGCFTFGLTYFAALPFALVGAGLGFFGKGNLRIACITLNFIALIPAVMLTVLFLVGSAGSGLRDAADRLPIPTSLARP
jgi:hypothetical protein